MKYLYKIGLILSVVLTAGACSGHNGDLHISALLISRIYRLYYRAGEIFLQPRLDKGRTGE